MRVLNYGSLNIDYVYQQAHIVRPGETLASSEMQVHAGGKGANQSAALGLAGVQVFHAGCIGQDGLFLLETLGQTGVDTHLVTTDAAHSGHAIIQVDANGENAIILFGGGNQENTPEQIDVALSEFEAGDILLLQNEINNIPLIMRKAAEKGLFIYFNPAPFTDEIKSFPLDLVSCFILNETEGAGMSDCADMEKVLGRLHELYPQADMVLTLGGDGVQFKSATQEFRVAALSVDVVDTTAAGDTFIGYYLASVINGMDKQLSLKRACCAAAIAVGKAGAMGSVPDPASVDALFAKSA